MRPRIRASQAPRWPFWLLIAAWFCANSPQAAVSAALTWLAEARTFSHQRELSREVAHLLGGEKAQGRVAAALAEAAQNESAKRMPAIPAAAVLKKIDLAAEERTEVEPAEAVRNFVWRRENRMGAVRRAEPAHGPPRLSLV